METEIVTGGIDIAIRENVRSTTANTGFLEIIVLVHQDRLDSNKLLRNKLLVNFHKIDLSNSFSYLLLLSRR